MLTLNFPSALTLFCGVNFSQPFGRRAVGCSRLRSNTQETGLDLVMAMMINISSVDQNMKTYLNEQTVLTRMCFLIDAALPINLHCSR